MKKLIKIFLLLIFLLPIVVFTANFAPTGFSSEKTRFLIPLEMTHEETISKLKEDRYIRSEAFFKFILPFVKPFGKIEPGAYLLSHRMNTWQIADTLLNRPYQKWVVLIPGLRKEQTAEKLAEKLDWNDEKKKEFLESAKEGYLFPDTYLINLDYSGKEAAAKLTANFNEKFDAKLQNDLLAQNVRNDTTVKIASLIERESDQNDKALIAGIIWNRLNTGMRLQIDATNQYALGKPGNWWSKVSGEDMKVDSPYNTYLYKGLPPGPICSPGLEAIRAAIYPEETECLFYLHDHDKQIHCSVTYEEHLENIEKYLK